MRNVRDFSVKRLPSGSTIAVWLNNAIRCCVRRQGAETLRVLKYRPNPHGDRPRHCQ